MNASQSSADNHVVNFARQILLYIPNESISIALESCFVSLHTTATHPSDILAKLVQHAPELLSLCESHPELTDALKIFIHYLEADVPTDPRETFTDIADVYMYRSISQQYDMVYEFFIHYVDYLYFVNNIVAANRVFTHQLAKYGIGVHYARKFIYRYYRKYNNLTEVAETLPQLFAGNNTALYLRIVTGDTFVDRYLASYNIDMSLSDISHIDPRIVKRDFTRLTARCLRYYNFDKRVEALRAQCVKDSETVYNQLMSGYCEKNSISLIKAYISYM